MKLAFKNYAKLNQPPGSLAYTGEYKNEPLLIEVYRYNIEEWNYEIITSINEVIIDEDHVTWINVVGLSQIEFIKSLGETYNISPLVLEDVVHVSQRTKLEAFPEYLFGIFKMMYQIDHNHVNHEHLSFLVFENMIVTFQETKGDVFSHVRERIRENIGHIRAKKSDYLFYTLLDAMIDQYIEVLNEIAITLDDIEVAIFEDKENIMTSVYEVKKELLFIKSVSFPIKDIINQLKYGESELISEDTLVYMTDLKDHISQIMDSVMLYREMTNSLYEIQMSYASNNMNQVMTILTVFSAIFIPMSFLTGFFGMNFNYIPGLNNHAGIYILIASFLIIAGGMLAYFKSKKWF